GAEQLLYTNLKHVDKRSVFSQVVVLNKEQPFWRKQIEELGINVTDLGVRSNRDVPIAVFRLFRRLREWKPDLIHTHLWASHIVGRIAGSLYGCKVISSLHSPEGAYGGLSAAVPVSPVKIVLADLLNKWTARLAAHHLIAVSGY